jgi:NADP-dependent 3-hydroxy acid dehydrogenase YdfG
MIDINVKGLLYVSKAIIPNDRKEIRSYYQHRFHCCKEVYPNGNVYCATKHAVDALNQGMRMDLNPFVGAIHPGMVQTEFSEVRLKEIRIEPKSISRVHALQPEDIADIIHFVVSRPYHINIADLVVMSTAQASTIIKKIRIFILLLLMYRFHIRKFSD